MIRSSKEFAAVRRERASLINLRVMTERVLRSYGISDQTVIAILNDTINKLGEDLNRYSLHPPNQALIDDLRSQKKLPELLIQARRSMGWSKADLARRMEISPQQIGRYESSMYSTISLSNAFVMVDLFSEELERAITAHQYSDGDRDLM